MKRSLLLACLLLAAPAHGVLNDTGNGNTTAPPAGQDPGWSNQGRIKGLNCVYVGHGWVATAGHVGTSSGLATLDGVAYPIVASTITRIAHDVSADADLKVMKLDPHPRHLPVLGIRPMASPPGPDPPPIGTPVLMIGRGRDRGDASTWGPGGWEWAAERTKRWGTNLIGGVVAGGGPLPVAGILVANGSDLTQTLVTEFTQNAPPEDSPHESQGAGDDSGGGLFIETFEGSGVWELAGIAWARTAQSGQPAETSIYGNDTFYVDLSYYRAKILEVVRPCDDGVDNDGDGDTDSDDLQCGWPGDDSEEPQCSDGIDNDFDGDMDYPADAECSSADDLFEDLDLDGDFVADDQDSCLEVPNPDQRDTNQDGYGNACDPDYTNDGIIGQPDFVDLSLAYGSVSGEPEYSADVDWDGDGIIASPEFNFFSIFFGGAPGPSGLACAGSVPCP